MFYGGKLIRFGMWNTYYLMMLSVIVTKLVQGGWEQNIFHQMIQNIANETEATDCWICSHGPTSQREGWPLMVGTLLSQKGWSNLRPQNYEMTETLLDPGQAIITHAETSPEAPACIIWEKDERWTQDRDNPLHTHQIELGHYPNCNLLLHVFKTEASEDISLLARLEHSRRVKRFDGVVSPELGTHIKQAQAKVASRGRDPPKAPSKGLPQGQGEPPVEGPQQSRGESNPAKVVKGVEAHQEVPKSLVAKGGLSQGLYWICGQWAGKILPPFWEGTCTIGTLMLADVTIYPEQQSQVTWRREREEQRLKRAYDETIGYDPDQTYLNEGERLGAILFPAAGVALNIKQIRRLSAQVERLANKTVAGIRALQTEVDSLAGVLMQHKLALDYLLSVQGGLCSFLNTTCCHYINKSGEIESDIDKIQKVVSTIRIEYAPKGESVFGWLTEWLPNFQWLKDLIVVGFVILIIGILIMFLLPCVIACLRNMIERIVTTANARHGSQLKQLMTLEIEEMQQLSRENKVV
ncbi:uncharacterized protein [Anolis sagrei]|uniref:uncharacterized protein n=1 Tax=Anolis sagrei TaxID=38937 RepID=UPI0035210D94